MQPAFIDVAGQSFPIAGAAFAEGMTVGDQSGYRLRLGTWPVDCGAPGPFITLTSIGDISLELSFQPGQPVLGDLEGRAIGVPTGTYHGDATGLTVEGLPPPSDAAVVEVTLGGHEVIASTEKGGAGYPVSLRGKVRATACPKPVVAR